MKTTRNVMAFFLLSWLLGPVSPVPLQAEVLFEEKFDHPDMGLLQVAGSPWMHSSGNEGEVNVVQQQLELSEDESEDVAADIPGGPYSADRGSILFLGLSVTAAALPGGDGNYFAHFRGGSSGSFRGRLFITTKGAAAGMYRLGVSNGSSDVAEAAIAPRDLTLNETHRIVLRYKVATATTTLWIDPATQEDSSVTAADLARVQSQTRIAFRQARSGRHGIGKLWVDNVRVATSFDEVAASENRAGVLFFSPGAVVIREDAREPAVIEVTRNGDLKGDLEAMIEFSGSAERGVDFKFDGSTLVIPDGQSSVLLPITVVNDEEPEAPETIVITLIETGSAGTRSTRTVLTIEDDEVSDGTLLREGFDYPDGLLVGAPGSRWTHRSGNAGEINVTLGRLELSETESEDASALLNGEVLKPDSTKTLYAGFDLLALSPPSGAGNYFAHFRGDGSGSFRGRVFVRTLAGSDPPALQLGVSNGASEADSWMREALQVGRWHRVVIGLDPGGGKTGLWVDPEARTDPQAVAQDETSSVSIHSYAFRQPSSTTMGIGQLLVDDLVIATRFERVTASEAPVLIQDDAMALAPGRLGDPVWDPGGFFRFVLSGGPRNYQLEYSGDLEDWKPLRTVRLETEFIELEVNSVPGVSTRFYRVQPAL